MSRARALPALRWAVVGPGAIANRFAQALAGVPRQQLSAVIGRDALRAQAFAARWSDPDRPARVHLTLEALSTDVQIDAVYIATPHAAHGQAVRAALEAGRHVLCEKPLVTNALEAEQLAALARTQGRLLMEAFWSRLLPVMPAVREWLAGGRIGRVQTLQASFCFPLPFDPQRRHFDPAQAGGVLLDIGVYPLGMARDLLAVQGERGVPTLQVAGRVGASGVDERVAMMLVWPGGAVGQFVCGFDGSAPNDMVLLGEHGHITLHGPFWECTQASLSRPGEPVQRWQQPLRINGFEYEIEEALRCVAEHRVESPAVPHADTVATLRLVDRMRRDLGVRFPFEPDAAR
ncbi:Gfo/Idh/MocA family oxidoreductase [uncultured Piscinibacter sp.]|uniref:Gfo/Idh/MocA family protein n=1 Tax=uncultured Piscinibacter sp. TaxID=1131835 RepID=UPI002609E41D|nr:Gfo/Idh/MocA family oxidoreductase [uncultured Piscinibacter sp.]